MRRLLSITLLLLFLLFHAGYYFIYVAMVAHNDKNWMAAERDEIDPDRVMTLAIPVKLRFAVDQEKYTDYNRSFQMDGKFYRAIQMRYANDTLHFKYVEDFSGSKIHHFLAKWVAQLTDPQQNSKEQPLLIKRLDKPFYSGDEYLLEPSLYGVAIRYGRMDPEKIEPPFLRIPVPPPESFLLS